MAIEFRKCEACGRSNRLTRKICFSCGANLSTGIVPPEKHEEPTSPSESSSSEQDARQTPVETVTDTNDDKKHLLGKIRAAFQWWAKHPWKVFWGILILPYLIVIPIAFLPESTLISLFEFDADSQPGIFVLLLIVVVQIVFTLLLIVMYLSVFRGMFLMWRQSKVTAALVVVGLAGLTWFGVVQLSIVNRRGYGSEVRLNLKDAAHAQQSYFAMNNFYKSCAHCTSSDLPRYNKSSKVTLRAETGTTGFVLTATHDNCKGEWTYQRTTGGITGPRASDVCK